MPHTLAISAGAFDPYWAQKAEEARHRDIVAKHAGATFIDLRPFAAMLAVVSVALLIGALF
jgi:hypothetical protein